ncbi:MAG: acetyl-CoA carboxylase biotin carboxylase subunit [Hyphomicrobiales bacterium]|nr:acetyl-CoA carboxylase biotin carboxylase subunit [Hyphomicrobiales bacterium]
MSRVLIANRGEIALRAIRSCRSLGMESVSVHSEADRNAPHTWMADRSLCIGAAPSPRSYLRGEALLHVARETGCDAVYPGYGFLSENADFAEACAAAGVTFVGPSADTLRDMGDKVKARRVAERFGVPVVPGSESAFATLAEAQAASAGIGFPLLLKARSGGGGRGMRMVEGPEAFAQAFTGASREAESAFGDGAMYLERYFPRVRHVEVQVFGDGRGGVLALGERDCSVQRRHQKLVEESPSPAVDEATRDRLVQAASDLAAGIAYRGAGTVEFILDVDTGDFFFIEMNTRIQVEHPVTEARTGLDLVTLQLRVAAGEDLPRLDPGAQPGGHAIEFRINAEDWANGFTPSPGTLGTWRPPAGPGLRFDGAVYEGYRVPPFYDSMIGKLIAHGADRDQALDRARRALDRFQVAGVATTIGFHRRLIDHPDFRAGRVHTRWVDDVAMEELV